MHTSKNYKRVFVARNCARTVGLTSSNVADKLAYGEIVAVNKGGQLIDTAAKAIAAKAIRFMIGTKDGSPIVTDLIFKKDLLSVESSKYVARQEKKVIIGYDGAANSIDVISGNVYAVEVDHIYRGAYSKEPFSTRASYESPLTGATQFNIAQNLAQLLAYDYSIFDETVRVNIISDQAGVAGMTGAEVINGSPSVSYTGGTAPAVGNAVVVPGLTGGIHRDEDNSLYKVIYVDATNSVIELDRPYQNRDQSGLAVTTIAAPGTGAYGLTLEGMPMVVNFKEAYSVMDFDTRIFGFGTTLLQAKGATLAQNEGFGRHEPVANAEYLNGDGEGRNIYQTQEFQAPNINTDSGTGYSMVNIRFDHMSSPNMINNHSVPKEVDVYLQRGTYADIAADAAGTAFGTNIETGTGLSGVDGTSFLNVINAFAVNAGVLTATANTVANGGKEITAGITLFSNGIDV